MQVRNGYWLELAHILLFSDYSKTILRLFSEYSKNSENHPTVLVDRFGDSHTGGGGWLDRAETPFTDQ